jgi:DNA-binding PadR family transcriptional regulator
MKQEITPTGASILGFLLDTPMTGWDITQKAQTVIGSFWSLTTSQVYSELQRLHQHGFIRVKGTGTRSKVIYEITDTGTQTFQTWAMQPPGDENIRFPLVLMVSFGRYIPSGRLAEYITTHRSIHVARLKQYEDWLPITSDTFQRATLELGIKYEQAILEWLNDLENTIH